MESITLEVILSEIKRIELVHSSQFKSIREEIGGIKTEIGGMKTEIGGIKAEIGGMKSEMVKMNARLGRLEEDVQVIRNQTATLTEGHMDHERRLRQLEGLSVGK